MYPPHQRRNASFIQQKSRQFAYYLTSVRLLNSILPLCYFVGFPLLAFFVAILFSAIWLFQLTPPGRFQNTKNSFSLTWSLINLLLHSTVAPGATSVAFLIKITSFCVEESYRTFLKNCDDGILTKRRPSLLRPISISWLIVIRTRTADQTLHKRRNAFVLNEYRNAQNLHKLRSRFCRIIF